MSHERIDATNVNRNQVWIFLGLTFGLTFLLDLFLYLTVGYGANAGTSFLLQMQMLIPASVAMILQLFVFKSSPIYHLKDRTRWFFYSYLGYALFHLLLAVSVVFVPNRTYQTIASVLIQLLLIAGLVLVVVLRLLLGKEPFHRAGLSGGQFRYYVLFGLLFVAIYGVMTGLNVLFGLGQPVNVKELLSQAAGGQAAGLDLIPGWALLLIVGAQSVLLGPILGLLVAFGEEYGWRGYLQGELVKMGKVRGILLLGIIWGLWHVPVIAMGHNYPGYPLLGSILMTFYTVALAFILGYAVLKSGSVWLAAFLHALNNQVASFLMVAVYMPNDPVFSFGVGLYGLVIWALVVGALLMLDRKEWLAASPSQLEPTIVPEET
jgi:membrane protease YdiL (CAAX protease family)